jgi:hypothetical protein
LDFDLSLLSSTGYHPIFGIVFDITWKLFSNMYYPTQTQIHMEIEDLAKRDRKRASKKGKKAAAALESGEDA